MHQGGSLMSLLPGLASSQAHASEGLIRRRRTRSDPVSQAVRMIWAAMDGSTSEDGVQEAEAERRSSSTMNPHRSQPVVGARVDVADYLGQLAAQFVHGQHVVLELTGFVRGQLVHRLDELLLGAYQPVQGFRGRAVVAGGSRQMADAVVLQVVVAFQRRLVARVAHPGRRGPA